MKIHFKLCAAACAALLLVPLAACSQGAQKSDQTGTISGGGSSGTRIVGKVTSVVGNQVTLAVGTLNRTENSASGGGRWQSGGNRSGAGSSASAASSSSSSSASEESGGSSSSSLITLTGETKTVLIPVGLSLTTGRTGSSRSASGTGSARGETSGGGTSTGGYSGGFSGGSGGASGGSAGRSGFSTGKSGGSGSTAAAQTTQRTRDFSSITKGMILQITEKTLSDGTQGIVQVAVLSE